MYVCKRLIFILFVSGRADKRKKQMRRSGAASETGSEHSHGSARQSTEIRVSQNKHTLIENGLVLMIS